MKLANFNSLDVFIKGRSIVTSCLGLGGFFVTQRDGKEGGG